MNTLWLAVVFILVVFSLPGTVELFILTLASLFHSKTKQRNHTSDSIAAKRIAITIPAHDEALNIRRCVESVLVSIESEKSDVARSVESLVDVWVIADNCTDNTAELAAQSGASVLERQHDELRGKGYALDFAFQNLLNKGYDGFIVIDADSQVEPDMVTHFVRAFEEGNDAMQCRYAVLNAAESVRTRLMSVALMAFNVLRPKGRAGLGLSAGILGNGFALSRRCLETVPYTAASVVEDLEYHIMLVRAGLKVTFLDQATVKADMPVGRSGNETQRARWEGGRFRMLGLFGPSLIRDVLGGRWRLIEPLLDLLLMPLAYHLLLVISLLTVVSFGSFAWAGAYAIFAFIVVLIHVLAAVFVGGGGWAELKALAFAPIYILWKLTVLRLIASQAKGESEWVRTERDSGVHVSDQSTPLSDQPPSNGSLALGSADTSHTKEHSHG